RVFAAVGGQSLFPLLPCLGTSGTQVLVEVLVHLGGHFELFVSPRVSRLGQRDFLFAERGPVGSVGVRLVGGTPRDDAFEDDQRRFVGGRLELLQGGVDRVQVVGVGHGEDVPA